MKFSANNPPAFPVAEIPGEHNVEYGMSLRDWFAGQVLAGMFASESDKFPRGSWVDRAEEAYLMADAMLATRKETE